MVVCGDRVVSGRFLTVEPHTRIVFSWGWEDDDPAVPLGTSTVDITFEPNGGATLLRLTHHGLPLEMVDPHRQGWNHYLDRLVIRATGGDPGPDVSGISA